LFPFNLGKSKGKKTSAHNLPESRSTGRQKHNKKTAKEVGKGKKKKKEKLVPYIASNPEAPTRG